VPDQDWPEAREEPPPALPDGSMPSYGSHPLPGMPGGDPPLAAFGWGPELGGDDEDPLGQGIPPPGARTGLVVGLLVICGVVLVFLIVVASRGNDSPSSGTASVVDSQAVAKSVAGALSRV
jgi:uncharacterized protein